VALTLAVLSKFAGIEREEVSAWVEVVRVVSALV